MVGLGYYWGVGCACVEGGGFCESWYGGGGHLGLWGHGGGGVCLDGCQGGCVGVGTREELQPLPDPAGGGGVGLVEGELLRLSPSLLRGVGEVLLVLLLLLGCHLHACLAVSSQDLTNPYRLETAVGPATPHTPPHSPLVLPAAVHQGGDVEGAGYRVLLIVIRMGITTVHLEAHCSQIQD